MIMAKISLSLLIPIAVVVAAFMVYESEGLNDQGQYLLEVKSSIVDGFGHLGSWNSSDLTPCGWTGVGCSDGLYPVVLSLDLSSMNLSGSLSPSIGGLVHLNYLNLSFNEISEGIPKAIGNCLYLKILCLNNNNFEGQIPTEIGRLSYLQVLNVCNNRISGPFPEEIGNLSSLSQLIAYTNKLSGPLPHSIGNLKSLRTLRAGENLISGSLPSEIGECESLEYLGLAECQLSGEIPKEIGKLEKLSVLILWGNLISGVIPKELGNCTNLEILALYENELEGEIPKELGSIVFMKKLYIYRNKLNGTIPRELGNLSLATEVDFSENFLSGEIPVELSKIAGLQLLYLFKNQLTGVIPDELTSLTNLTKLDLSINYLTGSIPTGFQYMNELMMLQLFNNMLSGIIPQALGVYSPLWVVDLSENLLTGRIPRHICRNSNLILLNVGSNRLSGSIPPGVTGVIGCKSLVQLRLVGNNLTGIFPAEMCKLVNLSAVELDQNKFSGALPPAIGNCKTLQRLHLSDNYFTAELPREIGNLSQLVIFNVSSNLLTGRIPTEMFDCKMLQRLDLSNNNFLDVLPNEIGALSQLELLKLSDNNLSGDIPVALGNLLHLTELQMGGNSFTGVIPTELGAISSLQIGLNLSYNRLSGEIPPQLGNLILLELLLLDNNLLTGGIPSSFENLSSLLGCNFSYNNLKGTIPPLPVFQTMEASSFAGNKGLCGHPLGACEAAPSSLSFPPDVANKRTRLGKIIAIVSAAIGGISLILIVIIIYFMRRPVDNIVISLQEKPWSLPVLDMYFSPKAGFTFQDLVVATENFDESYAIGRGACGTVYKASLPHGHTVAVKKVVSNREGNNVDNSFHAEILTLGNIRHGNIVKLYGFCYHQGSNLLLYEYMSRGSLGELLHGNSCSLDWQTRFTIAVGAAQGLSYLHHDCKPRIFHRDIKSNNILLDDKFEAHVGDFGLAKVIDMPHSKSMSAVAGSYGYIAPEYAYTMKVTEKCDIYSYGVVLLELLTGRTPVQTIDEGGDLVTWVRNYIFNHSLSSEVLDARLKLQDEDEAEAAATVSHMITVLKIALLCTSTSPFDRPSMREVVSMLIGSNVREKRVHFDDDSPTDNDTNSTSKQTEP